MSPYLSVPPTNRISWMTLIFTPYAIINLLGTLMACMVALITWQRENLGGRYLAHTLLASAIWCGGAAMEHATPNITGQIFWAKVQYFGALSVPVFYLLFSAQYNQLSHWLKPARIIPLFIVPIITLALALTNEQHHLIWTSFTPSPAGNNITIFGHGPGFWAGVIGYSYLLILAGTGVFIRGLLKVSKAYHNQIALIFGATFAPWVVNMIYISGMSPVPGLELTPLVIIFSGVLSEWAVVEGLRYQLVEKSNALEALVKDLTQEIGKREKLEHSLRQSQEIISVQLAAQSTKLAGLYDLILVNEQAPAPQNILSITLEKISSAINSHSTLYWQYSADNQLRLENILGEGLGGYTIGQPLPDHWLPVSTDVRAFLSTRQSGLLPAELRQGEDCAVLFRWVLAQNRPLGILAAFWESGYQFSVEEIALFTALADGLGMIMENSRLRRSVAETAAQQERRRLARDLHDSVTQSLHSLVLTSQTALEEKNDPEQLQRILKRLDVSAQQSLKEMRLLLYELRLISPSETSLLELLKTRFDAVERRANINADLITEQKSGWPKEYDAQLYPILIEALNNSLKHARASSVSVRFSGTPAALQVEIADNGCGFDPAALPPGGMGLNSMAERCERLGASLEILSSPQTGTTIRVKKNPEENHAAAQEIPHGKNPSITG